MSDRGNQKVGRARKSDGRSSATRGEGYAGEAAIVSINWAFDTLGWTNVIHSITPGNTASQRVAQKLGSKRLGPGKLPPPFEHDPVDIWGQTREEWRRRFK